MTFQQRLKDLLDENQIRYITLAHKTGIPVTTLSNYINRGSSPSITQLVEIANFFNVSIDYLVGREDDFGNVTVAGDGVRLSEQERELLDAFDTLGPFERDGILVQVKALAKMNKREVIKK